MTRISNWFIWLFAWLIGFLIIYLGVKLKQPDKLNKNTWYGKFFIILAMVLSALTPKGEAMSSMPSNKPDEIREQNTIDNLKQNQQWQEFQTRWQNIAKYEDTNYDKIKPTIEKEKRKNKTLLNPLISEGYITSNVIEVLNDIYGERLYHQLRSFAALCYDPTSVGIELMDRRNNIEKQLVLLEELKEQSDVSSEVIIQAQKNLANDMEFLLLFQEGVITWSETMPISEADVRPEIWETLPYIVLLERDELGEEIILTGSLQEQLEKEPTWQELKERWQAANELGYSFNNAREDLEKEQKQNLILMIPLITKKYFSRKTADLINRAYYERAYHKLRMQATCYRPLAMRANIQSVRQSIEQRATLLEGLGNDKTLSEEVLEQAYQNLAIDLELIYRLDEFWEIRKSEGWEATEEQRDELNNYFIMFYDDNKSLNEMEAEGFSLRENLLETAKLLVWLSR